MSQQEEELLPEDEQKQLALRIILEAWEDALAQGVSAEMIASSAIFAALTDMIEHYGEEAVAEMVAEWPGRIRNSEFTLSQDSQYSS
tara:strand:- start:4750 stop:5010 length:261 start_codon:yes stop_codon:yes gene_type:complete